MSWKLDAFDDEQDDECVEDFEEISWCYDKRPLIHSSSIRACNSN